MLYQFDDEITSVALDELRDNELTVGYVSFDELTDIYKEFNFPLQAVEMCREQSLSSGSYIEVYDNCYFIRIAVPCSERDNLNSVGVLVSKNLLLVVNISEKEFANRDLFLKMMSKVCVENACVEKLLSAFFECLAFVDSARLDELRAEIDALEETVINNKSDESFNIRLLEVKKSILSCRSYYEGLIDISQTLAENDNELFNEGIKNFSLFTDKVNRLKDNADILTDSAVHLWDAYQALLNTRLNETMKVFTLVTTIFFPLTVIVGWYGMNFRYMPELGWKYGYIYVILFSIAVICALIYWFKRKHWI